MNKKYADIAPALPLKTGGLQTYTYQIPKQQERVIKKFSTVTIPFGKRHITGVVIKTHSTKVPYPTKPVAQVSPVTLTYKQILFAKWISETMQGGLGYTLRLFQPPGKTTSRTAKLRATKKIQVKPNILKALSNNSTALINRNEVSRQTFLSDLINHNASLDKQTLTIVPEKTMLAGPGTSYSANLKKKEATTIWHAVKSGRITAVRGTQKALYLPFKSLGLIVIEEEQYFTHKLWDQYPRLHNKDAVITLAQIHNCPILYATSYPSIDTYYRIKNGQTKSLLSKPIKPRVSVIAPSFDDQLRKYVIPRRLIVKIKKWTATGDKTLIFYDRTNNDRLRFILKANLSEASHKNCTISTSKVFAQDPRKKFDRIVWLFPERTLSFPDYRSVEKSLIFLTRLHQLSNSLRRNIYIVTKEPSTTNDILKPMEEIYDKELRVRKPLQLPPHQAQVKLRISSTNQNKANKKSQDILKHIQKNLSTATKTQPNIIIRGPYQSNNKKQWFILLRGPLEQLIELYSGLDVDYADLSPTTII